MTNRDEKLPQSGDDKSENGDRFEETFDSNSVPAGDSEETRSFEASTGATKNIGPYKLRQKLGEGGMGTVWMAEQKQPVRRRVALKVIKAGMDSKQVIARFEAERQALAMMDHQNIAKVLDAGMTEDERPYFAMELVQGIPITKYCDDNKLTLDERLELFGPVCNAIQHAHQKGIIHRDLKPSNVLVTLYDGKPVPKVIDFGLAKALQHQTQLTDKTMFTEFGQVVGTLQYMSPEQAEMNALDVDTRTDIYSLGVMLYELLTGSTPLDAEMIKQNAFLQILQSIKEKEPPRPSARLSSSGDAITGISAQRKIAPAKLQQILRGELDWIVMKALEKDRTRRYETAVGLAHDVTRFLNNEVVLARPPSFVYRARKFVRKNRTAVAALASIAVVASIVFSAFKYNTAIAKHENDKQRATTLVTSLQATSGTAVPLILENFDELPRALVLKELSDRHVDAKGQQKLNVAYGLAHYGQIEIDAIVAAAIDKNTKSDEVVNIVRALEGERGQAVRQLNISADEATKKMDWITKSRLAVIAMYLGDTLIAEDMLAATKSDPVERTTFISEFPKWAGEVELLAEKLDGTENLHFCSGICLSMGGMERPDQAAKDAWRSTFSTWYTDSPDSGTHSAAQWVMNQWDLKLPYIEESKIPNGNRNWWHAPGLRFVKIPVGNLERSRPIVISDEFWLSDSEITVGLFQRFIADKEYTDNDKEFSEMKPLDWPGAYVFDGVESPDLPVQRVSWFDAVKFCNWLSKQLGLEPYYEIKIEKTGATEWDRLYTVKLLATDGIRLPTEAEWEFACRTRTTTKFFFGDAERGLDSYGWFEGNSNGRTQLVATKRCNAWGLFDMHGNVWEWCTNLETSRRVTRGGCWFRLAGYCGSSEHDWTQPWKRSRNVGFRVARGPSSQSSESSK